MVALSLAHLRQRAEATAQAFEAQCKALGVRAESRLVVEEALDAMVEHGRCSDLIVVGQTDRHQAPDGLAFDFPQQALLHAGPPVLIVPCAGVFASVGQNVLVAWKGTRESANAVRNALPVLRSAQRVTLVEVGDAPDRAAGDDSLMSAKAWLESHGIEVHAHRELALAERRRPAAVARHRHRRRPDRLRRLRPFAPARMDARRRDAPPARAHEGARALLALTAMDVLFLLVPLSVLLVFALLAVFAWALQTSQFDDLQREGARILGDDADVDGNQAAP